MMREKLMAVLTLICLFVCATMSQSLTVDGTKLERIFDGIGGLSGGGATSRFLPNYESPYIDEILDFLFLPNFGASLQLLKVEIGGDAQSTEGTEASHMHTEDDLNFERGYEWWLMQEAKARNPNIKLYGLTWGVPGWIGGGNTTNYYTEANIVYHINWLKGAKGVYNLDIDYIGVWNERMWNDEWIINFRAALDQAGFGKTQIVAPDQGWGIANDMLKSPALMEAVSVIGVHYPGTYSTSQALQTNKPLWASEDYSSFADSVGGGCWARILNQNYVNGYMTSTISWNLIAAYYNDVPWAGCGLMIANNPWSGHYDVMSPIWVSAHTTQFTAPGWVYLAHGNGTGHLPKGGSYVTLVPPNSNGDFSMIIETMTRDHSICVRPYLNDYTVTPQNVTFQLQGGLKTGPLYVWYTHLSIFGENTYFENVNTINATSDGQFTLELDLDSIVTVSTLTGQQKGQHPTPPDSTRFPTTYSDDFESYKLYSEAKYFDDQTGSFEIQEGLGGSLVMRQMVLEPTIYWCPESQGPISVVGPFTSATMTATISVYIEDEGATAALAIKVQGGGCGNLYPGGYFLQISTDGKWTITANSKTLASGTANINATGWTELTLSSTPTKVCGFINSNSIGCVDGTMFVDGFAAIGSSFNHVQFDNFKLNASYLECQSGSDIISAYCESGLNNQVWKFNSDGTIQSQSGNCLAAGNIDPNSKNHTVILAACDSSNPMQRWDYDGIEIHLPAVNNGCLRLLNYDQNDCVPIEVNDCSFGDYSQNWWFNSETNQIISGANMMCVTVGTAA